MICGIAPRPKNLYVQMVTAFYFASLSNAKCERVTPKLLEVAAELKALNKPFNVVYVSSDSNAEDLQKATASKPWSSVISYKEESVRKLLAEKFGVVGIPTLVFSFKDGTHRNDGRSLILATGADGYPWALSSKEKEQDAVKGAAPEQEDELQDDTLGKFIDWKLSSDVRGVLRSEDDDPQMLLHVTFTELVKIRSLKFHAKENGPKVVKLFVNPVALDFQDAAARTATQTATLKKADEKVVTQYVRFQNVRTLAIFVASNQNGSLQTIVEGIEFIGTPRDSMNVANIKKS